MAVRRPAALNTSPNRPYSAKLGIALYDYDNTLGIENPVGQTIYDYTAPLFMQKGNTLFNLEPTGPQKFGLASQFRDLDITARWTWPVGTRST